MEEMLILTVMPIMSIYQLPLGLYGYTGHVISLPQDVISFAHSLAKLPSELDVLVERKEQDQFSESDVLLYLKLLSGCWKPTSTTE